MKKGRKKEAKIVINNVFGIYYNPKEDRYIPASLLFFGEN